MVSFVTHPHTPDLALFEVCLPPSKAPTSRLQAGWKERKLSSRQDWENLQREGKFETLETTLLLRDWLVGYLRERDNTFTVSRRAVRRRTSRMEGAHRRTAVAHRPAGLPIRSLLCVSELLSTHQVHTGTQTLTLQYFTGGHRGKTNICK